MFKYLMRKASAKEQFPGCSNFQAAITHEGGVFALKQ
jgi:hypothetical protein